MMAKKKDGSGANDHSEGADQPKYDEVKLVLDKLKNRHLNAINDLLRGASDKWSPKPATFTRDSCPFCHGQGWRRNGQRCTSCNSSGRP
jgi:hypothetical protein